MAILEFTGFYMGSEKCDLKNIFNEIKFKQLKY